MKIRALTKTEQKYTFFQSHQLEGETGSIGYLRGDFGSSGQEFYVNWYDICKWLKTDEFQLAFNKTINYLRSDECGLLKDIASMRSFIRNHLYSAFDGPHCVEFGFRVDIEQYACFIRCNITDNDYNFYCFCFVSKSLDGHIERASKGIRFIDPEYNELFRIPDGAPILIKRLTGEEDTYYCRYIDDYHTEIDGEIYHICEFAEHMMRNNHKVEPYRE